jgi:hypothetical protein
VLKWSLLQNLNEGNLVLEEDTNIIGQFRLETYPLEMDGDAETEWIIRLCFDNGYCDDTIWLPVDINSEGNYVEIANDLDQTDRYPISSEEIFDLTHDLTGDHRADLVLIYYGYLMGANFGSIEAFSWNGKGFYNLETIHFYMPAVEWGPEISWEIGDLDGNGREELRVVTPRSENFGCSWENIRTFSWNGLQPVYQESGAEPPHTAECNVYRALSFDPDQTRQEKIVLLKNLLVNQSSEIAASGDYQALLRVHLAEAYAEMGLDAEAQNQLRLTSQVENGKWYAQQVEQQYHESGGNFLQFCNSMYRTIYDGRTLEWPPDSDVTNYFRLDAVLGVYPYNGEIYAPMMCPLHQFVQSRFDLLQEKTNIDLAEWMVQQGFPYDPLEADNPNLDSSGLEIGQIELIQPYLVINDTQTRNLKLLQTTFDGPVEKYEFLLKDADLDGDDELMILARLEEPLPIGSHFFCERGDSVTEIRILRKTANHFETIFENYGCGEPPSIEEVFSDQNVAGMMAKAAKEANDIPGFETAWWYPDIVIAELTKDMEDEEAAPGLFGVLDQITEEVLDNETPLTTRGKIMALLETLPEDEEAAQLVRNRLLYLKGVSYQLEGKDAMAIETYLDLIQSDPDSPWSWLAFARLHFASAPAGG